MGVATSNSSSVAEERATARRAEVRPLLQSEGERARLGRLYDEYAKFVAWFASRILSSPQEVEDTVQEVFMIAAKSLAQLQEPAQIRGWLKTVTVRHALRRLRWRRVRTGFGLLHPDAIDETLISADANPEDRAALRHILEALEDMPPNLRLAWSLRYLHEETVETVAELCACSLATAKRRIAAAQLRIKGEAGDA